MARASGGANNMHPLSVGGGGGGGGGRGAQTEKIQNLYNRAKHIGFIL